MVMTNKYAPKMLQSSIISLRTEKNIVTFMEKYPAFTLLYKDELIEKIKEASFHTGETEHFRNYLYSKDALTDLSYDLLEAMYLSLDDISNANYVRIAFLDIPSLKRYCEIADNLNEVNHCEDQRMKQMLVIQAALDAYCPCLHPNEVITEIMSIFGSLYSVITVSDEAANSAITQAGIPNKYPEKNFQDIITNIFLVRKYFIDVYNVPDKKREFVKRIFALETQAYGTVDEMDKILIRYDKYLGDTDINTLYDMLNVFVNVTNPNRRERELCELAKMIVYDTTPSDLNNTRMCILFDVLAIGEKMGVSPECRIAIKNITHNNFGETPDPATDIVIESISRFIPADGISYAMEAYKKNSGTMHKAQHNIYKAYRNYKKAEDKVDSQITQMTQWGKKLLIGDVKKEIIEGKEFSAIGLLKKALTTAALFSFGPLQGLIGLVVSYALKKKTTVSERSKILLELEAEIEMVTEKIEDARGDGNREAKYKLMRTKTELQNATYKIRMGLEADQRSIQTAKNTINKVRGG